MADFSDEADRGRSAQPRLVCTDDQTCRSDGRKRLWAVLVSLIAFLVAVVTIKWAPEVREVPPTLQTFVRPKTQAAPPAAPRSETKKSTEPLIRVNVTPGGTDSMELDLRGSFRLVSLDRDEKLPVDLKSGRIVVSSTKKGLKLGSRQCSSSQIEIQPDQSPAVRINGHLYRGRIRLYRRHDGQITAVNVLPMEEYLGSVLDSEMPAKFPEAARQAQAIVARTYALYQAKHADPNSVFDLLASQRSQKYLGVEYVDSSGRRLAGESESSRRAVQATRGLVCTLRKELFCTYYSAVCGGRTIHGNEVFKDAAEVLKSVPCEWCRESPHYRWTTELSREDFQQRAVTSAKQRPDKTTISSVKQTKAPGQGSISQFVISDGTQRPSVSGIELRERLPAGTLFSPHFRIKLEKDRVVFEGQGHGHGVGFCQWGAKGQAEAGRSSLEIIRHYYPGTEITDLNY